MDDNVTAFIERFVASSSWRGILLSAGLKVLQRFQCTESPRLGSPKPPGQGIVPRQSSMLPEIFKQWSAHGTTSAALVALVDGGRVCRMRSMSGGSRSPLLPRKVLLNLYLNTILPLGAGNELNTSGCRIRNRSGDAEPWMLPMPVHVVTNSAQLPMSFLQPNSDQPLVIGFDCEGVNLARHGRLCIMQLAFDDAVYLVDAVEGGNELMQACRLGLESPYVTKVCHDCKRDSEALYFQYNIKLNNVFDTQIAYSLLEEQLGNKWVPDDYISFVDLLADDRYCGVDYDEKEGVRLLLKKDPQFWTRRPWNEKMKRVAADDVRFLLRLYKRMLELLTELSKWRLSVRSSLYCRCFCSVDDHFIPCPLPPFPEELVDGQPPEEEVLAAVDVPPGKMGLIIGKKGISILEIKKSCRCDIFIGGLKGPPDKVFVIGAVKEVRKAEAILRGKFIPN